jgi:NAD(P)-dependent dehydrogenase (short-subunit alcohol dehydrogenase family)
MKKTILITGASSGIGRETALLFARAGWQVAAGMRSPEKESELTQFQNVFIPRLDVHNDEQVDFAVRQTIERFGSIDVLVNNAGYGLVAPFERAGAEQVQRQFATNVFGLMRVTRAVIPVMRRQKAGVILNVASIGGRMTFPFYSLYHATKWCVEGFSESLRYELLPARIRVKVIEPGPILTDFYTRSAETLIEPEDPEYGCLSASAMKRMGVFVRFFGSKPAAVARVIYRAANDGRSKFRYPAGWAAHWILASRKLLPDFIFSWFVRKITLG